MRLTSTEQEAALPIDRFTQTLKICLARDEERVTDFNLLRTTSLKLDLRAIQEVETMEGYATDADYEELLFAPKVQVFLSQPRHDYQEIKSFWLMMRIRYLALLRPSQRAQVIQISNQAPCKPALLMAELYKLSKVSDRIRLLSRLSYQDFAALITETDKRELPLKADGGAFLSSIAVAKQNSEVRQSARRMFLAR